MTDDEYTPELDALIIRAHKTRGEILDYTIHLERILEEFISLAFSDTKDRQRDLLDLLITEGMNYRYKVKTVLKIINRKLPDEKSRHRRLGSIRKDLEDIAATRNKFAHESMRIDLPIEYLRQFYIILYNFQTDKNIGYTEQDIIDAFQLIMKYVDLLSKLRREFWGQ